MDYIIKKIEALEKKILILEERNVALEKRVLKMEDCPKSEVFYQRYLEDKYSAKHSKSAYGVTDLETEDSIIEIKNWKSYKNDNNITKLLATFDIDWEKMYRNELTNRDIENYITECFMKKMGNDWWKVRGGETY